MTTVSDLKKAEADIAQILKALEIASGSIVDRIDLEDVEVTRMEDDRQVFQRRVSISLKRLPGSNW